MKPAPSRRSSAGRQPQEHEPDTQVVGAEGGGPGETPTAYQVPAELPGIKKEGSRITLGTNVLSIRVSEISRSDANQDNYHRIEAVYGPLRHAPSPCRPGSPKDRVEAKFATVCGPSRSPRRGGAPKKSMIV